MRLALLLCGLAFSVYVSAQDYDVLPHNTSSVRGRLSVMDGLTYINGANDSLANRYGLSLDLQIGPKHRFDLGWTVIDVISGSEHDPAVGNIDRDGDGPNIGYFIIPDQLWLMYTFESVSIRGSRVSDSVVSRGHQLAVGYRFYTYQSFNLSAQLSYLYAPRVTVPVLDLPSKTVNDATYPAAQIWTLGLVFGLESD